MCTENHFSSSLYYNSESDSFTYNSVEPIIIASIVLYFLPAYPNPAYNYAPKITLLTRIQKL